MKKIFPLWISILFLLIFSCKEKNKSESTASAETDSITELTHHQEDSLPPVETRKAETDYRPAFKNQTRVAGMKTNTPVEVEILTKSLKSPWGIVPLNEKEFLITQNKGDMVIVSNDGEIKSTLTGIPKVNSSGQGGLLGLTLDNDFENNQMVYWCFSEASDKGNLTAVAKGKLNRDKNKFEEVKVIYRAIPAYDGNLHYGGRVVMDAKGNLFVSTGERSDKVTRPQAQELNSALGKILYITTEGEPVKGNPFENQENALPEIYSYGHRNVQGLVIHPKTGELWESEFGPKGGDELNLIKPGKNYGWPTIGYGIEYNGDIIGEGITEKEGMEQPIYYWDPVLSPSGITFYSGKNIPEWENNIFLGGLNGNHIARLRLENNRVTGEERLLEKEKQRFRDVTQGKDGNLYAVTDEGRFYKLSAK